MKYSVLFLSLLLWGVANSATIIDQELEDVSQERALEMVKDAFFNKDVDYYLCTDSVDKWTFFVDAEPLKGWEHKCFIATIPKKILAGRSVFPNLTTLQLPPSGNITPVEIKKRYGINSTEKPNVIAESLPNYVLTAAERTYAVINSMISVNSTLQGITVLNMSIPIGTKIVRMDTSSLATGLYVLSYIVNGQIIDTLKFSK